MGTEGDNVRVIAGRYRLEERLGRGGMGVVWRATDRLLGRQVAVKELPLDDTLSQEQARRQREGTLREARAVARLGHPHIIVVHDVVEDDQRPYIVMELIDGVSLADRIAEHGPVDVIEVARIGIALLGALRAAHAAGVLHRDLKPANVLLEDGVVRDGVAQDGSGRAGPGRVVLTDFGVAQVAGASTLTETGTFVGSPEYTAPERISGAGTGPASDLWSLGALLCTALSGESPFRRDSLGGILHAVVSAEIRPPAQAAPILPVVRGLLERDPRRRLGAGEAERMLRDFLDTGRTPEGGGARERPAYSIRRVLVTAMLVTAMAGAGVSAAALLMEGGGDGGVVPTSSAPEGPGASVGTRSRSPLPSPSVSRSGSADVSTTVSTTFSTTVSTPTNRG
ncbi:serine/threonine-protein kinase [Streptomyces plumbiresistens]|uniref:non-specific serine/threonine protein kinase n=1 Tax=Streptomyces plumbiresistens TaxID=511811 RepID=A0ABP7T789_9ACTN